MPTPPSLLRRSNSFLVCFGVLVTLAALVGCTSESVVITTPSSKISVSVEIADTLIERALGLMHRPLLPENHGMLFLFPEETQGAFWMKDTPIPLDLLFIRSSKIVAMIENTAPFDETLLVPNATYTSVLEVPGGFSERHEVGIGNVITLPRAP